MLIILLSVLGMVVAVVIALVTYNWKTGNKVYQRDIEGLQAQIKEQTDRAKAELQERIESSMRDLEQRLPRELSERLGEQMSRWQADAAAQMNRWQADAAALSVVREADIRLVIKDYNGALRTAIEAFGAAQCGNGNFVAHVFDTMNATLASADNDGVRPDEQHLAQIRQILFAYPQQHNDPRAVTLRQQLDRLQTPRAL